LPIAVQNLLFEMRNCFLLCVPVLTIAYIICCRVNVILDIIKGMEDRFVPECTQSNRNLACIGHC